MNLGRIVKDKGIEFLESKPEIRVTMVKKSTPIFFTKMKVPIRGFQEFEIFMLTEGEISYINCGCLHELIYKRSSEVGIILSLPITQIIDRINLSSADYDNLDAKCVLNDYVSNKPCSDMSSFLSSSFLPIAKLDNVDSFLTNFGLTGADIRDDIDAFIGAICEVPSVGATTSSSLSDEKIHELLEVVSKVLLSNNALCENQVSILRDITGELKAMKNEISNLRSDLGKFTT